MKRVATKKFYTSFYIPQTISYWKFQFWFCKFDLKLYKCTGSGMIQLRYYQVNTKSTFFLFCLVGRILNGTLVSRIVKSSRIPWWPVLFWQKKLLLDWYTCMNVGDCRNLSTFIHQIFQEKATKYSRSWTYIIEANSTWA